ncbi:MAG: hypothetical protein KDD34_03180 [Bdellovibrionales bacterium]|nr:hypothetical protein [Bdellovibrionales bacterium]
MKIRKWISPLCVFLLAVSATYAHATIQLIGVTGASNSDITASTPVIYGGTSGSDCSGSAASTSDTCDSCASLTSFSACNKTRIYDSLILRISYKSDTMGGTTFITTSDGTTITATQTSTGNKGETVYVDVDWSTLCNALNSTSSCDNIDFAKIIKVGIDDGDSSTTNDELQISIKVHTPDYGAAGTFNEIGDCDTTTVTGGICSITVHPGDEKLGITELEQSSGFPTSGNIKIRALRFFIGSDETNPTTGFVTSPNDGLEPQDIEISTDENNNPETTKRYLKNLSNDIRHYVRVATVDDANNVSRFTSNASIDYYCGTNASTDTTAISDGCIFSAIPVEVVGLLSEDLNCFITSVAYGSGLDARVDVFREFRSKILRKNPLGRWFVSYYYKKGPLAAAWMMQHPWTKPVVRAALWPALGFAWLANQIGFFYTLAVSIFIAVILSVFLLTSIRRLRANQ